LYEQEVVKWHETIGFCLSHFSLKDKYPKELERATEEEVERIKDAGITIT
jgi:hypothetical protein